MTAGSPPAPPAKARLDGRWTGRPLHFSRRIWSILLVLDALPHPWGEDILAAIFVAKALVRPGRLREALAWASWHARGVRGRWRLALLTCAYHGRFVARLALVGVRRPEDFRQQVVLKGREHVGRGQEPIIFLAFHLGPPKAALALWMTGYPATWVGGWNWSRAWAREAWEPFRSPRSLSLSSDRSTWGPVLYRAYRILRARGSICITGDGAGREALRIRVPGGSVSIRSGWLSLRRQTGARVVPVLSHLDGRRQVVTIHPPLPAPVPDPAGDLEACRAALSAVLEDHVRRFPEQCYALAFRVPGERGLAPGRRSGPRPRRASSLRGGVAT